MKYKKSKLLELKSGAERQSVYYYNCPDCHEKRQTVFKNKAENAIGCRNCIKVNKDQMSLLTEVKQ